MGNKADEKVLEMRKTLLEKRAELSKAEKPEYKAGAFFRPFAQNQRGEFQVNIATENQLLEGLKSLLNHNRAAEMLSMDPKHLGFSTEIWIEDFKTRKSVLDKNKKLQEIKVIESKLIPLLTPKQLREIGIEDLSADIENL